MPTLGTWVTAHKGDTVRDTFWLVKLGLTSPVYLTDCDQPIFYDGHKFAPDALAVEGVQSDAAASEAGGGRLTLGAGGTYWQALLADLAGGLRAFEVTLWEAWADVANFPSAVPAEVRAVAALRVEAAEWDRSAIVLTLGPAANPVLSRLPFREYQTICTYRTFKGAQCGYSGAETTCDRTYAACTARSNTTRFGGFVTLPADELTVSARWTSGGVDMYDAVTLRRRGD